MKEHPEELLAAFADGDLRERDREAVEAHLAGCERCSQELVLARRAVSALSRLEEVPAPLGLATPAIQQAKPVRAWGERLQWAAGIGAAAALIGVFAVIAVRSADPERGALGEGPAATVQNDADSGAEGGGGGAPEAASQFVSTDANYDAEDLQALVRREAGAGDGADAVTGRVTSALSEAEIAEATRCVEQAGLQAQEGAVLIRVEAARYQDDPAYVVLFERDETVEVWVVDRETCAIRYVASAQREP